MLASLNSTSLNSTVPSRFNTTHVKSNEKPFLFEPSIPQTNDPYKININGTTSGDGEFSKTIGNYDNIKLEGTDDTGVGQFSILSLKQCESLSKSALIEKEKADKLIEEIRNSGLLEGEPLNKIIEDLRKVDWEKNAESITRMNKFEKKSNLILKFILFVSTILGLLTRSFFVFLNSTERQEIIDLEDIANELVVVFETTNLNNDVMPNGEHFVDVVLRIIDEVTPVYLESQNEFVRNYAEYILSIAKLELIFRSGTPKRGGLLKKKSRRNRNSRKKTKKRKTRKHKVRIKINRKP